MKNLLLGLLFLGYMGTGQSQELNKQELIKMEPVKVETSEISFKLDPATNSLRMEIPTSESVVFHTNPLIYAETNFDIQKLIKDNDSKYDSYVVYFVSSRGKLLVNYDKNGQTVSTFQKFKNVELPYETNLEIFRDYRDWDIVNNRYVAASRNGEIKREFYRVKLENGKKSKRLKFQVAKGNSALGLALK